jgi:hypothetical protein
MIKSDNNSTIDVIAVKALSLLIVALRKFCTDFSPIKNGKIIKEKKTDVNKAARIRMMCCEI